MKPLTAPLQFGVGCHELGEGLLPEQPVVRSGIVSRAECAVPAAWEADRLLHALSTALVALREAGQHGDADRIGDIRSRHLRRLIDRRRGYRTEDYHWRDMAYPHEPPGRYARPFVCPECPHDA